MAISLPSLINRVLPPDTRREMIDALFPLTPPDPADARTQISPVIRPLVDFNTRAEGLADRLVWNLKVNPTTTLNHDGSFMRSIRIRSKRDLTWAPLQQKNLVADLINRAFTEWHDGWMIHARLARRPITHYPEADYPDMASWLVHEERRVAFEAGSHYSTDIYYTFTYLPPADTQARVDASLTREIKSSRKRSKAERKKTKTISLTRLQAEKTFDEGVARVENLLREKFEFEALGITIEQDATGRDYAADQQLALLLHGLTGRDQPVRSIRPGAVISEYLALDITPLDGGVLRVGDSLVKPITIVDLPESSLPTLLDDLEQIPGRFDIVHRWIGRDPERARSEMRALRGRALSKRASLTDQISESSAALEDPEAYRSANDATLAFGESSSRVVSFGYYTLSVIAYEPIGTDGMAAAHARVSALAAKLTGSLSTSGFIVASDYNYEIETLLGSLEGHGRDNLVRGMLSSRNLANLLPTRTLWTGDWFAPDVENFGHNQPPLAVFSGVGVTPCALNLHVGKRGGHTLLCGETGAGKSTLAGFLVSEHRKYETSQQVIIDSENQHYVHGLSIGADCTLVRLAPDSGTGLSPLAGSDSDGIPDRAEFVALLIEQSGHDPRDFADSVYTGLLYLCEQPLERQTISGLMNMPDMVPELRNILRAYSKHGAAGSLLDNPPRSNRTRMTIFETHNVAGNKALYTVVLAALELEINRMCSERKPTMIVSEEFWGLLKTPIGCKIFEAGLRTKRRKGGHYLLLTQSVTDIDDSPIAKTIIGSCVTKIILPTSLANKEYAKRFEILGMASWERDEIAKYEGQPVAFVMQPAGSRLLSTKLGPVGLSKVGQTSETAIDRAQAIFDEFGPDDFFPELVNIVCEPDRSKMRARIGESWRRHAYFYPARHDATDNLVPAPAHPTPSPRDPYAAHIDTAAFAAR